MRKMESWMAQWVRLSACAACGRGFRLGKSQQLVVVCFVFLFVTLDFTLPILRSPRLCALK